MANIDLDALFLSSLSAAGLPSKGYMNLTHLKQVAGGFFLVKQWVCEKECKYINQTHKIKPYFQQKRLSRW